MVDLKVAVNVDVKNITKKQTNTAFNENLQSNKKDEFVQKKLEKYREIRELKKLDVKFSNNFEIAVDSDSIYSLCEELEKSKSRMFQISINLFHLSFSIKKK